MIDQARKFVFVAGPVSPLWQGENGDLAQDTGPCTRAGPKAAEDAARGAIGRIVIANTRNGGRT